MRGTKERKNKLKVLDLFSGIGCISLGLERTGGFETVLFCEKDKHCHAILKKHWPDVPIVRDVTKLTSKTIDAVKEFARNMAASSFTTCYPPRFNKIDVVCGGFPCTDISFAGNQEGILHGKQSSLWREYARVIDEVEPRYAIIENVEHLRKNGLGVVLNDLSRIGYDAEWFVATAKSVGLPHQRKRLFIISYPSRKRLDGHTREERHLQTNEERSSKEIHSEGQQCQSITGEIREVLSKGTFESISTTYPNQFASVSSVHRVTDGFAGELERERKERIRQLGNAVVPQIPQLIGEAILKFESNKDQS